MHTCIRDICTIIIICLQIYVIGYSCWSDTSFTIVNDLLLIVGTCIHRYTIYLQVNIIILMLAKAVNSIAYLNAMLIIVSILVFPFL